MLNEYDLHLFEFLKAVYIDSYGSPHVETIIYTGELLEYEDGFCYLYKYRNKHGNIVSGCGIVRNPEYAGLSSSELILKLNIEYPVTDDDKKHMMDRWEIAEKEIVHDA